MLKRKLAIISLSFVLALALTLLGVLALDLVIPSSPSPDLSANAAVSAAGSFDKLLNGSKYYYSTANSSNSNTAVTVDSSQGHGTQKNPFVINNINQWVLFSNMIAANNGTYQGKYYVLGADLDFANNTIASAGANVNFTGTIYGNKHVIRRANITAGGSSGGLIYALNGGSVYDLIIDSSCTFNMTVNKSLNAGTLTGYANNATIVNVHSNANLTVSNGSLTSYQYLTTGGLIGLTEAGNIKIYKSSYTGTIKTINIASSVTVYGNDNCSMGGLIGRVNNSNLTVQGCAVTVAFNQYGGDSQTGGVWGLGAGLTYNVSYSTINITARTLSGPTGQCELAAVGQHWGITARPTNCSLSNVYVRTGSLTLTSNALIWGYASTSGAYPPTNCTTVVIDKADVVGGTNNSNPIGAAAGNGTIAGIYNISGTTVTNKINSTYNLSYIKGAGATGGPSDTTYSYSSAAQTKSGVASPSRTGYTFKGWSLASHKGALSNTDKTKVTIPAGQRGNINVYAVWELNAFTGSASGATVTYGSDATLSASGIGHPAGTTNSSYGVTLSYQWKNSAGTAISGATSSTYKLTTPGYTAGTNYQVTVTATPKDGVSAAKSQTFTVTLKVNKQGVAAPSVASGLIYNGSEQTGITASSSHVTLGGTIKATDAGSYTATASLPNANYCWGSNGGTDSAQKSYTWTIAKQAVAVPTITAGSSQVYTGSLLKPTTSTNTLYTVTNAGGTDVGSYTVSFNLVTPKNYKWATAPSTGESGRYDITWNITKANITTTAPSFTSNGALGKVYVGQTIADLTIDQSTGTHVRAGSQDTVPGTYTWKLASNTRISNKTTGLVVTFTPNDTKNYNSSEATVTIAPTQLYINVQEVRIEFLNAEGQVVAYDGYGFSKGDATKEQLELLRSITSLRRNASGAIVKVPVDYNVKFDLSKLNVDRKGKVTLADGEMELNWQLPKGYNIEFFSGVDGSNNGAGSYGSNPVTPALTADLKVYLGYTGKQVNYTIVTVKQDLGANTPINAEIIAALDSVGGIGSLPAGALACVEVTTGTAQAGSRVSYPAQTMEGFTRKNSLTATGDRTFISDDQAKFVLGEGETILVTYYERNSYTVTWTFTGGVIEKDKIEGATKDIANRWNIRYKYGEDLTRAPDPTYQGYTFDNWYSDSALTTVATIPSKMPGRNLTFYAGRSSVTYNVTFDSNIEYILELCGITVLPDAYLADLSKSMPSELLYTIEQIINNGVIRLTNPSMEGFRFLGWYYYDSPEDQATHTNGHRLTSITRTTANDYQLYAIWEPINYTVSLNTQNNVQYEHSSVQITNMGEVPFEVGGFDGSMYDGKYDPDTDVPAGFYLPTRPGYTFLYWAFKNKEGNFAQAAEGAVYDVKLYGQTLYAIWQPNPVRIKFADGVDSTHFRISIKSSGNPNGPDAEFTPEETINHDLLYKDDTLTINITPSAGYDVSSINISGTGFNNGGMYTVRTYTDDTMIITVQLVEKRFNITYVWDGGSFVGDSEIRQPARTFTLSETIKLVGGELLTREGYVFAGWHVNSPTGVIQGDPTKKTTDVPAEYFGPRNTILYASWTPAPVKMVYHNNRIGSNGQEEIREIENTTDIVTGARIQLYVPESDGFTPENYELIGWSLTPDGDIAFNVSYHYIYDGDNSYFEAQPVYYNVQASADNTNHLYARWRVANVQYLTFEAENNNTTFRPDADYEGVTLTARPRFTYTQDSNLKMKFTWFKVDPENTALWQKWTEADLEGLKDDELNQAQSNVAIGMYKIPRDSNGNLLVQPILVSSEMSNIAPLDQKHSKTLKNVNESGLYLCMLEATGTYFSSSGGYKTSTITMYGQYDVIINKANLDAITMTSPTEPSVYNGEQQGISVTWPGTWTAESDLIRVLPDGSKIKVNYTYIYTDAEGNDVEVKDSVKNVGSYRVVASFEFLNDKGNYNVPASLNGQFEVNRLEINEVTYELQTLINGQWTKVDNFIGNKYSRQPFRIVATPTNLAASDKGLVQIAIYYDGNEDHTAAPVNVGEYNAYCDALVGTELGDSSANYILSASLPKREFSIIKADHDISVTFKNQTATYDGKEHALSIESIIEGGDAANPVEILNDQITLKDGCTITLQYSIECIYVDARYSDALPAGNRSGLHAGVYTVTVSFVDTDENAVNFNKFNDITATLTIEQAPYKGDGEHVGLSDAQLQRYITVDGKQEQNPNGFGDNHTVDFAGDKGYNPQLSLDSNYFEVEYAREFKSQGSSSFVKLEKLPTFDNGTKEGLHEAGTYRVTASIKYVNIQYANDYVSIPDYTVELKILPGVIDRIEVVYDQAAHEQTIGSYNSDFKGFTYGDTFDFYDMDGTNYVVTVKVVYKASQVGGAETSEVVDNENVSFLNEKGTAFEKFDRATIKEDSLGESNTPASPDGDVFYKVGVSIYGETGTLNIKVRQAKLVSDTIGFDAENDSNIQRVSGVRQWTYGFTYDGEARYPALSNSITNAAYNFVGIDGDVLTKDKDITAVYEYKLASAGESDWQSMTNSDNTIKGLADANIYNLRVKFTNHNTNYKDLVEADTILNCTVNILSKELASSDILWQYDDGNGFKNLQPNANLTYHGPSGFTVRAVFRNLAIKNSADPNYYLPVSSIALIENNVEGTAAGTIEIADASTYSIRIKALQTTNNNYVLPEGLSANITIDPAKVTLNWISSDGPNTLIYNGYNQLVENGSVPAGIDASYSTPDDFHEGPDQDSAVSIKVSTFNGEAVSDGYALENVGLYSLTATLADTNYVASNPTYEVRIKPYVVTDTEASDISWMYQYGSTDYKLFKDLTENLIYSGAYIPVYIQFATIGADAGIVSEGSKAYRRVQVEYADATAPTGAGDYELSIAYKDGENYDLSNLKLKFTIDKRIVEVNWQEQNSYVYNGQDQTIEASAKGVGAESEDTIIVLADATKRNANQVSESYVAYAKVGDKYINNYALKDAATDGSVAFIWNITKKEIGVDWDTDGLVYNNGFDLTDWTYDVTGREPAGSGNEDNVSLVYEIYLKTTDGQVKVRNMNVAGDYVIKVVGLSDNNYAFTNVTEHTVTVDKAAPNISNVEYKEYAKKNETYAGNAHGLRNDKLTYVAMSGEHEVPGKLEFVNGDASAIANPSNGGKAFYCVFTPTDTDNYKTIENIQITITVNTDGVTGIGFNQNTISTIYAVGQTFRPPFIEMYLKYASYYEETVNNETKVYGKSVAIDDNSKAQFKLNNKEINYEKGYSFKEEDVGEQIIYVLILAEGKTQCGEIHITVSNAIPTSITVTNKKELESGKYYVGTTFDKFLAEFYVEYETESSNGPISAASVDIQNASLTAIGSWRITFTYFTNSDYEVKDYIDINVSPKEVIKIGRVDGTYRWLDGEPIIPVVKQVNGEPLPDDIKYSITFENGSPATIRDEGTYTIIIKFNAPADIYEPIEDVTATIVVKRIVAELDPDKLKTPVDTRTYTGTALTKDDYILRGISIIDNEGLGNRYDIISQTYTVNGKSADSYVIRDAGEYIFVASFLVRSQVGEGEEALEFTIEHEYVITITQAQNEITNFTINDWVLGKDDGKVIFHSAFGEDTVTYEYYLIESDTDEQGVFVGYELPTSVGKYRVVATVIDTNNYTKVSQTETFKILKESISDDTLVDENGKNVVEVNKGDDGVDPYYTLSVNTLTTEEKEKVNIRNQVVVTGYDIKILDADKQVVKEPGSYTIRLLLTEEQRDSKNFKNLKVYLVDEYGVTIHEVKNAKVDDEGYIVFTTNDFNGNFIVSAQDSAALAQMYWIIGLSVGGVIALAAIIILIIVVIKKKKEND